MARKLIIPVDIGGGDGGKGTVVHTLCHRLKAHTVVKMGGGQGCHGVYTSSGLNYNFSHWGCGTLTGVPTHISKLFVMDPGAMQVEAQELRDEIGIRYPFEMMTVHGETLCTTPYHGVASRFKEMARKNNPRGTVGIGMGQTVLYSKLHPELTIRAKDLKSPHLVEKLEAVRLQILKDLESLIANIDNFLPADLENAKQDLWFIRNENMSRVIANDLWELSRLMKVVGDDYVAERILGADGAAVVEPSQGVLIDPYSGFHPHITKVSTLPNYMVDYAKSLQYDGKIVKLGITRGYQVRHGAGPMVTEEPGLQDVLFPGSFREENRFQGKVRIGPLDFVTCRYAVEICKGLDGVCVTWFDQQRQFGKWQVCDSYTAPPSEFLSADGRTLQVYCGPETGRVNYLERLGKFLGQCRPNLETYELPASMSFGEMAELCRNVFMERLGVPVKMISTGPTENDKLCF